MERVDLKKLEVAIKYVDRISKGCNPVNNLPLEEKEALNNPNVMRCMEFIKEVLTVVEQNDGVIGKIEQVLQDKYTGFPYEILKDFKYEEDKQITYLIKQIYAPIMDENIKMIPTKRITDWLIQAGYLQEEFSEKYDKKVKVVTEKGKELGLYNEKREARGMHYLAVVYGKKAQEYIVNNFKQIVEKKYLDIS